MDPRSNVAVATAAAANGNFPSSSGIATHGGTFQVFLDGDFNGATATLETKRAGGTEWVAYEDGAFTAPNHDYNVELGKNTAVRLVVTGAGSPAPAIDCVLVPVRFYE